MNESDKAVMQQALKVLNGCLEHPDAADVITALESAIAQPEQPAVAWRIRAPDHEWAFCSKKSYDFCVEDDLDAQELYVKLPAAIRQGGDA